MTIKDIEDQIELAKKYANDKGLNYQDFIILDNESAGDFSAVYFTTDDEGKAMLEFVV